MLDLKPALKKPHKSARLLCRFEPASPLTAQDVSQEQLAALGSEDGHLFVVNLKYYRLALARPLQVDRPDGSTLLSRLVEAGRDQDQLHPLARLLLARSRAG